MELMALVEDQSALCRMGEIAIMEENLKRLIANFRDRSMVEK